MTKKILNIINLNPKLIYCVNNQIYYCINNHKF